VRTGQSVASVADASTDSAINALNIFLIPVLKALVKEYGLQQSTEQKYPKVAYTAEGGKFCPQCVSHNSGGVNRLLVLTAS